MINHSSGFCWVCFLGIPPDFFLAFLAVCSKWDVFGKQFFDTGKRKWSTVGLLCSSFLSRACHLCCVSGGCDVHCFIGLFVMHSCLVFNEYILYDSCLCFCCCIFVVWFMLHKGWVFCGVIDVQCFTAMTRAWLHVSKGNQFAVLVESFLIWNAGQSNETLLQQECILALRKKWKWRG